MAQPGSYDGPTARMCAELSFNAYKIPDDIKQRVAELIPGAVVRVIPRLPGDSQVVVVAAGNDIFVIFRGTVKTSWRSIVANLNARRRTYWGVGRVHRGFLNILLGASPRISQELREHHSGSKNVYFAGHSQGGAAAYLAAVTFMLRMTSQAPAAVYTFGQPRAGNAEFSRGAEKRLKNSLSRITNGNDMFVGLPFVSMGYDHTLDYLHYRPDWRISRRRQSAGQGWPSLSLRDHGMLQYLQRSQYNFKKPLAPP